MKEKKELQEDSAEMKGQLTSLRTQYNTTQKQMWDAIEKMQKGLEEKTISNKVVSMLEKKAVDTKEIKALKQQVRTLSQSRKDEMIHSSKHEASLKQHMKVYGVEKQQKDMELQDLKRQINSLTAETEQFSEIRDQVQEIRTQQNSMIDGFSV